MNYTSKHNEYLQLADVSIQFDADEIVHNFYLNLAKGDIGCLLGPSGCGKTTLLRAIAGFSTLSSGKILLDSNLISSSTYQLPPDKRHIGMVFQDHALFPHLSVLQNVMFGLHKQAKAEAKKQAIALIEQVGLSGYEQVMPHELSGGEQQRVALARALAPKPSLLLLDEPFSSLDVDLRESLARDVRNIVKETNTTALVVTHDQYEAFAMADQIGVIKSGSLQQWASAYDIYHKPHTRFVADFMGKSAFIKGEMLSSSQVRTQLGTFELSDLSSLRQLNANQQVDVLLRPDDIIHDDQSSLQAIVKAKVFYGAEFLYTIELANGEALLMLAPSHHDHPVNEPIGIRLEIDHVMVFECE